MLRLYGPAHNVSSKTKLITQLWIRSYASTSAEATIAVEQNPQQSGRSKRTKKKYSDLPSGRVLPDGSVAPPLKEWIGELNDSQSSSESSVQGHHIDFQTHRLISRLLDNRPQKEDDAELVPLADTAVTGTGGISLAQDQVVRLDSIPKPKRRRRKSAEGVSEEGPAVKTHRKIKALSGPEIPPEEQMISPSGEPYTQLAQEILNNLNKYPHCILLTRVGQFYESYFDQAQEVSRLLDIKLTSRNWNSGRVAMCGFPLMHIDKYLKTLVQQNKRFVAMCEEFPRSPELGPKGGFDRRVVRIITPGTLIDETFLNQYENNFLLAISVGSSAPEAPTDAHETTSEFPVGLSWIDVSTGEFFARETDSKSLRDELARIGPREVVIDEALNQQENHPLRQALAEEELFVSYARPSTDVFSSFSTVSRDDTDDLVGLGGGDAPTVESSAHSVPSLFGTHEKLAVNLLTTYLHANLLEHMPLLLSPNREASEGRMQIDSHTIKSLEIRESMREGGTTGSLLSVVKRTTTSSGTRLLARWLCSPSTSIKEINARQSLVAFLYNRPHLRDDLALFLNDIEDASRIVQRFLLGRGDPGDLSAIGSTISICSALRDRIALERSMEQRERGLNPEDWASLDSLMSRMNDLSHLAAQIGRALQASRVDAMTSTPGDSTQDVFRRLLPGERWTVKPEFSDHLTALHAKLNKHLSEVSLLEERFQRESDARSLILRTTPGMGAHVHCRKRDCKNLKESSDFVLLNETGSTASFFNKAWSNLAQDVIDVTAAIMSAEKDVFGTLRNQVSAEAVHLRRNARIVDELDATMAFANLAAEMRFVQPTLVDKPIFDVTNGRHPTVELGLLKAGRMFAPNSVAIGKDSTMHIITGPNMAGKSTLLRQTAIIAILAQTGSFVPADRAALGIVDKLFSRVGAKDDLYRDRSTFMVEMLETAEILSRATPRSLVIMDEVGRGTTVKDGLAIAFATIHHLVKTNQCRTLFATHFHELADMLGVTVANSGRGVFESVRFYCTDVEETAEGRFSYSHRLRPGVNRDSHGLKVAQLAGMPHTAISVAYEALAELRLLDRQETNRRMNLEILGQKLAMAGNITQQTINISSTL